MLRPVEKNPPRVRTGTSDACVIGSCCAQINNLLGAINRRQKRDKIILGVVIGLCTVLMLHYGMG